jgi:WD40 repeat protein/serine/threonine protein kinase/tetratricopeptide (TPR) repeat protein
MSDANPGLMTIFAEALKQPDPPARAAYLDRACGGDAALRGRVEALLAAHAGAGRFLEPDAAARPEDPTHLPPDATAAYEPQPPHPTEQLTGAVHPDSGGASPPSEPISSTVIAGRYTLVEIIGEGGMGSVYRAEQTEPVKRQVALKLIKGGTDSKAVLARFEAERQALALMDHPNIARVFDGGTTDKGQPFFVMELVQGVPLTEYCDQKRLSVKARLELFVSVCQAVQHAHQKGIIHRDLKPGNVLVTEVDSRPTPKVIDFGVAKATEVRLTDLSFADTGAIVGTPAYMSPEQADPSSMDIDTRTDVYALGVMLYELLVGSPPIDARQFKRGALMEMLRMVREVDPPRPSTKLSAAEDLPNIAANRDIEPAKLAKSLRGELDWVVMKALEKDRTRRYETANAFAHDLQRYLADEVVEARPPSRGYRLKKFVRRHKGQVIAVSLVFLALLAGMAGTTWGLFEARDQEQIARGETVEKDKARLAEIEQRNLAVGRADDLTYQLGVSNMVLASAAYDNRDVVLAAERLENVSEKQRGWEWRYLKQQTRGGLFTLYGHTEAVVSVAFSPDGERIVTESGHNNRRDEPCQVKVWDAQTGTAVLELNYLRQPGVTQLFNLGGTRLATAGPDNTVRLWDARTGKLQCELKHTSPVVRGLLSPDGSRVATICGDGMVKVWDAETGKPQWEFKGTRISAAFSPDSTRLFIGPVDKQKALLCDAGTGKPLVELLEYNGRRGLAFSPDGTRIVIGSLGQAKVWDAEKGGPPLFVLKQVTDKGKMDTVGCVAFSPDGTRLVTGGGEGDLRALVWDAETGTPLPFELKGHTSVVLCVAFSPDGKRIVTGSLDRTVRVWDAKTGTALLELKGFAERVTSVAFSPDGMRIVTGELGFTVTVWDARSAKPPPILKGHTGYVGPMAFSPDGTRIVTGSLNELKVWAARTGAILLDLKGHESNVWRVAFSPDGTRIVTGGGSGEPGEPGEVKVWDARTGTPQRELKWDVQTGKVWDARTGAALLELKGPPYTLASVSLSPDGTRLVTSGGDGKKAVWDAGTGKELPGEAIPNTVANERTSPDGRVFAHREGTRVELIPLQPDEEELAYRRLHTQRNVGRYREGYLAARAAKHDFAAGFYLKLLPPAEQKVLTAEAAAEREIAAGRTEDALAHLAIVAAARPEDRELALKLAVLRAWFGQDQELADLCGRALESARGTSDPTTALVVARMCCLRPMPDKARQEAAMALAKKAVELDETNPLCRLTLGIAEYRSGHLTEADAALTAATTGAKNDWNVAGLAAFFRAMILFRQDKPDEARKLATEAAKMVGLPKDEKNPLATANPRFPLTHDALIGSLAHKEAKALIGFDANPAAPPPEKK